MSTRLKKVCLFQLISFFLILSLVGCNQDNSETNPSVPDNSTSLSDALNSIQGTWYLDYRKDQLISCNGTSGNMMSHTISDLSYSDFQFQFTMTPSNSIFVNGGGSSTSFQASDVCRMIGAGGDYNSPFFIYKSLNGNTLNPFIGASSDEEQLYFYSDVQFQFDDEIYVAGGKLTFLDNSNMTIEVTNSDQKIVILHFTKDGSNNINNSEISTLKGRFIANYSEQYYSNVLNETTNLSPFSMVITDSILDPTFSINPNTGNSDFFAFRNKFFICHGMDLDWDGMNGMNVSDYYPFGSDGSGNWLFREGQLMMIYDNVITLSKSYSWGRFERLKVVSNSSTELILRSFQDCNDYKDYHFNRIN